jgi:methylated-DNA-[protein]-cysteine S-methyltransferase
MVTANAWGYTLFDTSIGRCGVAWGPQGLVAVQLPEVNDGGTIARLIERHPEVPEAAPSGEVVEAIDDIAALLNGERTDLSEITLDMGGVPPFHSRVYELARTILPGDTMSYGELAIRAGSPGAARAVGQAMRRNPFAIVVPCHRVVAAGGKIGGFSASGGQCTKIRMLSLEAPPIASAAALGAADPVLGGRVCGPRRQPDRGTREPGRIV